MRRSDRRPPPQRRPPPRHPAAASRELGRLGERLAGEHFERLGFRVLERNVRTRGGEIDLIAFDGHTLVFAEVKSALAPPGRRPAGEPAPLERLGARQRARLRRLAAAWLCDRGRPRPRVESIRLDAVGVTIDPAGRLLHLEHVEAAW